MSISPLFFGLEIELHDKSQKLTENIFKLTSPYISISPLMLDN